MNLAGLVELVASEPAVAEALEDARSGAITALDIASPEAIRPLLVAALASTSRPILLITSTYREAESLTASLGSILGTDAVAYYPAW